jgi:hydroxylysine kinase
VTTSPAKNHAQRLLEESGLTSSHEPIDVMLVSMFLEERYRLTGR